MYFHYRKDWPEFRWDAEPLLDLVGAVRDLQGRLIYKMDSLGFDLKSEAFLTTLIEDITESSKIEGESLNTEEVRSSVAERLGMETLGLPKASRDVDGVVEMMLDATQNYSSKLTKERLFAWHSSLFPTGRSGLYKITVGEWRKEGQGPMQVVSGAMGKEKVHYVAPEAKLMEQEMKQFLEWYNSELPLEPVLKSAIAHLWFVSIHPFDDGNGRIARAIGDSLLARADRTNQRFYSMSSELMKYRKEYYNLLETTQKGSLDITHWIVWYFERLRDALNSTEVTLSKILKKADFWKKHENTKFNNRQKLMLQKLQADFKGKLNSSKWAKMTKVHRDTALRDLQDLVKKKVLKESGEGGRSTNYVLK